MINENDDFDKDDLPPRAVKPKPKGVSHKPDDLPEGFQDCYWCGRQFEIDKMRRERKYDIVVWICKDCQ